MLCSCEDVDFGGGRSAEPIGTEAMEFGEPFVNGGVSNPGAIVSVLIDTGS